MLGVFFPSTLHHNLSSTRWPRQDSVWMVDVLAVLPACRSLHRQENQSWVSEGVWRAEYSNRPAFMSRLHGPIIRLICGSQTPFLTVHVEGEHISIRAVEFIPADHGANVFRWNGITEGSALPCGGSLRASGSASTEQWCHSCPV